MTDREAKETEPGETSPRGRAGVETQRFFDELWRDRDPWALEESELDQRRYERQLELLADRRYGRALEIGCAGGSFTRRLEGLCETILAVDVAAAAIARAQAVSTPGNAAVEYRQVNVMDLDLEGEGTWDLVVLTETAYYLGWQYPMFDVAWLAHTLYAATRPGGRLLLANSISRDEGIMSRWLIDTYRDLIRNVGFEIEHEETLRGIKETVEFEIPISLFSRPG